MSGLIRPGPVFSLSQYRASVLASSWVNTILYVLEMVWIFLYLQRSSPPRRIKRNLILSLCLDTAGTIVVCANAYLWVVIHIDGFPTVNLWTTPALVLCNTGSAGLVQAFLVYRCWTLTNRRFLTFILVLTLLTFWTFSIIAAVSTALNPLIGEPFPLIATAVSSGCSVLADCLIAASLIWLLQSIETPFRATKNLLSLVSLYSLASGSVTAAWTIALTVSLFLNALICISLFACVGRVYTLTMLANLTFLRAQAKKKRTVVNVVSGQDDDVWSGDLVLALPGTFDSRQEPVLVLDSLCTTHAVNEQSESSKTSDHAKQPDRSRDLSVR